MDDLIDEIALIVICFIFAICVGSSNFAVVGVLASIVLVSICKFANEPIRVVLQIVFYVCGAVLSEVLFYIPVAVYLSMHESRWIERFVWVVPNVYLFVVSGATKVIVLEFILCLVASGFAIRNIREQIKREGYRFAYDELREDYLTFVNEQPKTDEEDCSHSERFDGLTERELAVVRLVAEGMDNREIASQLFLSEGTVRNHISSILAKKELSNRTQIAVLYYRG